MGSFKENNSMTDLRMLSDREGNSPWDMKDHFDKYLAKKLEENDLVSYWIINELYRYYLSALDNMKSTKIV
jgi:hypothetical protein